MLARNRGKLLWHTFIRQTNMWNFSRRQWATVNQNKFYLIFLYPEVLFHEQKRNQYTKNRNRNMFKGLVILVKILKYNVPYTKRYSPKSNSQSTKKAFIIWSHYLNMCTHTYTRTEAKTKDWKGVNERLTVVIFGGKIFSLFISFHSVQNF